MAQDATDGNTGTSDDNNNSSNDPCSCDCNDDNRDAPTDTHAAAADQNSADTRDDEVPVLNIDVKNVKNDGKAPADTDPGADDSSPESLLEAERAKSAQYEQRLKLALADYQNLSKRMSSEVQSSITAAMGGIMTDVAAIRDDFGRARDTFAKDGTDTAGLDSVLRNLDSVLQKYGVSPIDALGKTFDPAMHEAVSTETDPDLDENTIIKELRRGYMLKSTIIRPSIVVISKKE